MGEVFSFVVHMHQAGVVRVMMQITERFDMTREKLMLCEPKALCLVNCTKFHHFDSSTSSNGARKRERQPTM